MSAMFATVVQLTFFVFTVLCFGFVIRPLDVVSGSDVSQSSKQLTRTGNKPISAMDEILAINYNRTNVRSVENSERRGSVDEIILNSNDAQNVSRHLFEGDIVLDTTDDPEDLELSTLQERSKNKSAPSTPSKRQASRNLKWLWHSKQIPYLISTALDPVKPTILKAIDIFNAKTCVKFVPKQGYKSNYVLFDMRQGCYSRIGKSYARPGPQIISIGKYCDYEGLIIHEILHAVGFYHEQSRPDRQNHIEILWEHIKPGLEDQFLKYSHGDIDRFNINYNYRSIMHYGKNAFSKSPDLITMKPIDKKVELGNIEMSPEDVMELDALYRCKTNQFNSWTTWSSFSPCDVNCYKNRQRFCYGKTPTSCGGKPNSYGIENEYKKCTADECPASIDGHWGAWSSWGTCSQKCNEGRQRRNRSCDNPEPKNKGKNCKNVPVDYRICVQPRCSLDEDDTDFRNGRLGIWHNDLYDSPGLNWQFGQGKTKTERTGPLADHTTTKDFYLFVESSNHPNNANARLISKNLPKTGPGGKCLKFFYHMFGYTIGSLSAYLYPRGQPSKLLFFKKGEQGNDWKPAHVTLNTNVPYQLVFEAVIARPPYSDIAIDDVFIDNGDCGCQDKYMVCDKWKQGGFCKKSYDYMFMNCPRSCEFCDCKNTAKWNCNRWSMKQCKRNPLWMEVYCPVTCRVCGCYDKSIFCQSWKAIGECKRNPRYMKTSCRKTCKLCT